MELMWGSKDRVGSRITLRLRARGHAISASHDLGQP